MLAAHRLTLGAVLSAMSALALVAAAAGRGFGVAALVAAAVTVPLVVADVRRHLLPNVLTVPILLAGAADVVGGALDGGSIGPLASATAALVATALVLGVLHVAGGLGMGDVKLGAGLAVPASAADPGAAFAAPALAFLLAGFWAVPLVLRGDRERLAFGPFQLAAFWIVLLAR